MTISTIAPKRSQKAQFLRTNGGSHLVGIQNVLVPLDFSDCSLNALRYAQTLAEQFGVNLHLVHAFDFDYPPPMLAGIPMVVPEKDLARRARSRLSAVAAEYSPRIPKGNLHVVQGRAYHAICDLAGKLGVDLIITATHGLTGLRHLVLGSTAERIVQHAPCPVLVVRDGEHELPGTTEGGNPKLVWQPKKILVPVDFSDCSIAGMEFALRFATPWHAEVTLFHSVPISNLVSYDEFGCQPLMDLTSYAEETAKVEMRELCASLQARGIDAKAVVEFGSPAHEVCDYASTQDVELIVTSTHGSTGFSHVLMGSTAEHIVRYASCPVLVVRSQQRKLVE